MKTSIFVLLGLAVLSLAGCETLNGPQAYANAQAQREDCKAVVVTNTPDALRLANRDIPPDNPMARTEATLALGKIKQNEPPSIRDRIAPEESLTSKTLRGC
ncbi:MAG TPA: hypothetical protein VFQ93_10815 [Casimicrobiaceae bacterium]|jgi:hypothetical protein|nr:hypothetical protein [Casimicrobiaceae bacterium]